MKKVLISINVILLFLSIGASSLWGADFEIVNLTADINNGAYWPSLNDRGQVAYYVNMILPQWGGYNDVFIDGFSVCGSWKRYSSIEAYRLFYKVNVTVNGARFTEWHSSGGACLNNKGQLAWRQHGGGETDIFLDGENITADIDGSPNRISLNNMGQVAWQQAVGNSTHIFLDSVNLTPGLEGYAQAPSLNDHGQVAWVQASDKIVLDGVIIVQGPSVGAPSLNNRSQIAWSSLSPFGEWDILLDGTNLTSAIEGDARNPSLNDDGQIAWEQWTGEWDIFLDGVNITENLPGHATHPSLNNKGQVAFVCDGDVYLATPIQ